MSRTPWTAGYSPPEKPRGVDAYGTTAAEQHQGETIDAAHPPGGARPRLAYGAPDNERGLDELDDRIGGDDPDSIAAEDDFIGDGEVGDARAGRLVAPDEGAHEDAETDLIGRDVGIDGAARLGRGGRDARHRACPTTRTSDAE